MLFISPPFGNYINLPFTTSIHGSFTNETREGLLKQILKTLRYSFENKVWINKIGLRKRNRLGFKKRTTKGYHFNSHNR